jgi:hypothetical protein
MKSAKLNTRNSLYRGSALLLRCLLLLLTGRNGG